MANYFKLKPISTLLEEANAKGDGTLKRALNAWNLTALGIGAIIGAGIFVLTGSAAAQYAGPALTISFIIAAIGCAFAGLCYSELASLIPVAGSAYTYGYASLGEIVAWIIGWDLILELTFGAASIAVGWSGYVNSFLQDYEIYIPPQLIASPGTELIFFDERWHMLSSIQSTLEKQGIDPASLPHATGAFNLIAFLAIIAVTLLLIKGIQESAKFNSIIVGLKIAIILVFIGLAGEFIMGNWELAMSNWTPFIPENTGVFGQFGWSGIARGAGVIFFAYVGFDIVSTAAQEAHNPQRDMPIGILGSLFISTVLYILVTLFLTGVVKYTNLNVADPVAVGIDATGVTWGIIFVKLGAIVGLTTGMLVLSLGQSRIFYSMSRDGLLPKWLGDIHPKFRTPWKATLLSGITIATMAAILPFTIMGEMVSIGTLLAFVIVCAGVWALRVKNPDIPRPFKTPWVPFVPIMGVLVSGFMMISLPLVTWVRLIVWLVAGIFIYFLYGVKHSHIQHGTTPAIEEAGNASLKASSAELPVQAVAASAEAPAENHAETSSEVSAEASSGESAED
ncbi:MAG: amino acid permease [bacterium]|nr:amino acid permease [bacterium]